MSQCRFCKAPSVSYYECSIGGIGNFIEYCADHKEDAYKLGRRTDATFTHAPKETWEQRIAVLERDLAAARTGAASYMHDMEQAQADLAAAQAMIATYKEDYSDLMTENRRVVDERDQARTELAAAQESLSMETQRLNNQIADKHRILGELAAAQEERDRLRALLLDCKMLETSDGKVHLRSNIKAALAALKGSA